MTTEKKAQTNKKRENKIVVIYVLMNTQHQRVSLLLRSIILLTVKNCYIVRNIIYYFLTMYHAR